MAQKSLVTSTKDGKAKLRVKVSKETDAKAREAQKRESGEPATAFGKKVEDMPSPGFMGPPEGEGS
jgi:hypothetical protein